MSVRAVYGFVGFRFGITRHVARSVRIGEVELHVLRRRRRRQRIAELLRVERRQDVTRHPGSVGTVDAMFEEYHAGNLRVVAWREKDEPAVVAQVLPRS